MNKFLFFFGLIFTLAFSQLVLAQQSRFDRANELLSQNNIEEAVDIYKELESEGYSSGSLWFNMGISYVQMDSLGKAKFYFLRAGEFQNTEEVADEALNFIEDRLSRRSAVLPRLPWERFFDWLSYVFGKQFLLIGGLLLLNGAAGLVITGWFVDKGKIWFKRSSLAIAVAGLFSILSSAYLDYTDDRYLTGVMVENQTVMYQAPDTESAVITTVYEGYQMTVDAYESREQKGWNYVRLQNGMFGWIDSDLIMTF